MPYQYAAVAIEHDFYLTSSQSMDYFLYLEDVVVLCFESLQPLLSFSEAD
jgi:hypothetical protein